MSFSADSSQVSRQTCSRCQIPVETTTIRWMGPRRQFGPRRGARYAGELSSTLCISLNVTNLDREPEWVRHSRMPAGSQNEDQSPLAQGALAQTSTFSAA
jgi:hypothetical protein